MKVQRKKLTPRQEAVFRFVAKHFAEHQAMPALREIGEEFDIGSTNGVVCHLVALVKKGFLSWRRMKGGRALSRGYEIVGLSELIEPIVNQHIKTAIAEAIEVPLGRRRKNKGKSSTAR
jgi:SOS-response transcriptional repressor LexA